MIIKNTLDKTLDYKLDGKELILLPWLNLVDWFNETYLRNLMKNAFFLLEVTYLEYTENLEAKNEVNVKVENDIKEEIITTTNEVINKQPVSTEEIVKKVIKKK